MINETFTALFTLHSTSDHDSYRCWTTNRAKCSWITSEIKHYSTVL